MQFSQLRYFVSICRSQCNMTRAAEEFHISQPALTKAIRSLEDELEVNLFQRVGKRLRLTAEGEIFWEQAVSLLAHGDRVARNMEELGGKRNRLMVGTMSPIGAFAVSGIVRAFRQAYPEQPVQSRETIKKEILRDIQQEQVDVGILITNRISREEYSVLPFLQSQVVYCMKPEHPLAVEKSVTFQDILAYPMILEKNDSRQPPIIEKILQRRGLHADIFLCTQQHETAFQMLDGNLGYLAMREIAERQPGICYAILEEEAIKWEVGLVWKRNRRLDSDSGALIRFIRRKYKNSQNIL